MATPNPSQQQPSSPPSAPLTIFFDGTVAVFDDVTPEQAKAIMLFAADGNSSTLQNPQSGSSQLAKPRPDGGGDELRRIGNVGRLPMSQKSSLQCFLENREQRILLKSLYHGPQETCPSEDSS